MGGTVPIAAARFVELPVCLEVNGVARPERDQLHVPTNPVDDPKTTDAIAAQTPEFVAERLAGAGIFK